MRWCVYWQRLYEIDCVFYASEKEARDMAKELLDKAAAATDENGTPDWDITILRIVAEVRQVPFTNDYQIVELS